MEMLLIVTSPADPGRMLKLALTAVKITVFDTPLLSEVMLSVPLILLYRIKLDDVNVAVIVRTYVTPVVRTSL